MDPLFYGSIGTVSEMMKFAQASLNTGYEFETWIDLKRAVKPVTFDWILGNKDEIVGIAIESYNKLRKDNGWPYIDSFSDRIKMSLFDRVAKSYVELGKTQEKRLRIVQGCCNTANCSLIHFQHRLFEAICRLVKGNK